MSISATRKFMSSCNSSFESSRHADFKNVSLHPRLRGRIKNPFLTLVVLERDLGLVTKSDDTTLLLFLILLTSFEALAG